MNIPRAFFVASIEYDRPMVPYLNYEYLSLTSLHESLTDYSLDLSIIDLPLFTLFYASILEAALVIVRVLGPPIFDESNIAACVVISDT